MRRKDDWASAVREYYRDPAVRTRISEFLGRTVRGGASAAFISANDAGQDYRTAPLQVGELDRCLDEQKEIYRSLWDRRCLLADLDIEYVNFDHPGEAYLNFDQTLAWQQPVVDAVFAFLAQSGISALHVLSGRGPHFIWQIEQRSEAFRRLAKLGRVSPTLQGKYDEPLPPNSQSINPPMAKAYAGLSLVMEYLAQEIVHQASPASKIPVTLTAVETVSERGLRECVSLDLSEYGDPLHTRSVRVLFSVYYKPRQQEHFIGREIVRQIPPLFLLPVDHHKTKRISRMMRDANQARELARQSSSRIPEQSAGTLELIERYQNSQLAQTHDWFYSQEHEAPEQWANTYDATDYEMLPPSARQILQAPNDLLLKPACLRHIVRIFLSLGWHPRHIAGLVRSKLERDYGWGEEWFYYDAASRADFYCRLFTGLIRTGLDDPENWTCPPVSALREMARGWNEDFKPYEHSLKRRIEYDRLASRPFHRLFL